MSGYACYHSVQNLLPSSLLYKNIKIKIYRAVILAVITQACGTWSLTMRDEHRLRVCDNRALRKISGPKRHEVKGEWRRLHNEKLYDRYSSTNIIRVTKSRKKRWAGHVARVEDRRGGNKGFWWVNLRKGTIWNMFLDGRIILNGF